MNQPQACTKADLEQLVRLANRVFRGSGEGDMQREYPLVFGEENLDHCRIVKEGDRVVSHVGVCVRDTSILGCRVRVAAIGAVCTDADVRGKGYASLLMEDARRLALAEGAVLMLISGGRGLYHRLGYVTVGSYRHLQIAAAALPPAPAGLRVVPCGPAEIGALCALYQRSPVRYVRPVDDWAKLLGAGMLMNGPADCLGVWSAEGDLLAYLGAQRPRQGGALRVLEHGGSQPAAFAGLALAAARCASESVEVVAQPCSDDLPRLLLAAGAKERRVPFGGTLGILDPAGFFAAIRPYLRERLGPPADALAVQPLPSGGAALTLAGETHTLDTMGRLTAFAFGGDTDEARDVPPPPAAFAPAFPMPLVWYGYNYV